MKPILKLYRGYANEQELIVMGHVFKPTTKKDYDFQKKSFRNATSVIKMFQIKTSPNADVYLKYKKRRSIRLYLLSWPHSMPDNVAPHLCKPYGNSRF